MSETNDKMMIDPQDHCRPTASEQSIYLPDLIVGRISQLDWPTSISSIDQPVMAIGCYNVGIGSYGVPLNVINENQ